MSGELDIVPNAGCTLIMFGDSCEFDYTMHARCPVCRGFLPFNFPYEFRCGKCGIELIVIRSDDEDEPDSAIGTICTNGASSPDWRMRMQQKCKETQNRRAWRAWL